MCNHSPTCLLTEVCCSGNPAKSFLYGPDATVAVGDLVHGSALGGRRDELRGRSVLVLTRDQLTAALALIELDGIARRLVLCPSGFPAEQLRFIIDSADVDAVVADHSMPIPDMPAGGCSITCSANIIPANCDHKQSHQTEWILLTSGTTGLPKLVAHTLESLSGAIEPVTEPAGTIVWSTFYDIRRYGGLQIFLRTVLTGASMVFSSADEPTADFLVRAASHGVTHISGTPSHWRRELMSPSAHVIAPQYVRLSGEIVDQAILNRLRSFYPQARLGHAFASTEAGVAFDVNDGLAGFPSAFTGHRNSNVEMRVEDGTLRINSNRIASHYLGQQVKAIRDDDGFTDTGDSVDLRGDRYYFVGRQDGVINVGGLKVHPEEVEAVINRHPHVRVSLVKAKRNPITGALVVADIVLEKNSDTASERGDQVQNEILQLCREMLPRHKVPAAINFIADVPVLSTGKVAR